MPRSIERRRPLMESIAPCKYLEDPGAARQSISIHRTAEGACRLRQMDQISFRKQKKRRKNGLSVAGSICLSLPKRAFHPIRPTLVLPPSLFHPRGCPALTAPADSRQAWEAGGEKLSLNNGGAASGRDRPLKSLRDNAVCFCSSLNGRNVKSARAERSRPILRLIGSKNNDV